MRLEPADNDLTAKIESFRYGDRRITNFEMEIGSGGSPRALIGDTVPPRWRTIIAQRVARHPVSPRRASDRWRPQGLDCRNE